MMDVVFLAPAQAELAEAVVYYNAQREGLGEEFAEEGQRTIARIIEYPEVRIGYTMPTPCSKEDKVLQENRYRNSMSVFSEGIMSRLPKRDHEVSV
jgi:hypothetical protein